MGQAVANGAAGELLSGKVRQCLASVDHPETAQTVPFISFLSTCGLVSVPASEGCPFNFCDGDASPVT